MATLDLGVAEGAQHKNRPKNECDDSKYEARPAPPNEPFNDRSYASITHARFLSSREAS
jgi:hypothetical protein